MVLALGLLVGCTASCSGGGSQGDPIGPARASITVSPTVIDTGDRTNVTVRIFEFQTAAVAIKIQFPSALRYVSESSAYAVGLPDLVDTGPDEEASSGDATTLVYYFSLDSLIEQYGADEIDEDNITLLLQLEGLTDIQDGVVGVDIDIDNPDIPNDEEFDSTAPRFDAQAEDDVRVGIFSSSSSSSSGG